MNDYKRLTLKCQIDVITRIIDDIREGKYYNASILIRFELNDKSYNWYKPIDKIIDNQIGNLFYDIEHGTTLTIDFFKGQVTNLLYQLDQLD